MRTRRPPCSICLKGKGYTYSWPERCGVTPWEDGFANEVRRLDYEPVGMVTAAPGGARWFHQHFGVGNDPLRLTAWFGPHNPGRDAGAAGRKAHRLHGDRHQSGRHRDPVLDGRSVSSARNTKRRFARTACRAAWIRVGS